MLGCPCEVAANERAFPYCQASHGGFDTHSKPRPADASCGARHECSAAAERQAGNSLKKICQLVTVLLALDDAPADVFLEGLCKRAGVPQLLHFVQQRSASMSHLGSQCLQAAHQPGMHASQGRIAASNPCQSGLSYPHSQRLQTGSSTGGARQALNKRPAAVQQQCAGPGPPHCQCKGHS